MSEQALHDYYEANHDRFVDVIRTAHILVEEEAFARELHGRVASGEDFTALAAAHSICPSSAQGGDLGFFPRGLFVAEYEAASRTLTEIGQLTPPVKSQFGWHIIKLLDKKDILPFEECRDTVAMIVEHEK